MMNPRKIAPPLNDDTTWTEPNQLGSNANVDQERIAKAITSILEAIGEDPHRDGLRDTPARVARMYAEIFSGLHQEPRDILSTRFQVGHNEVVVVKDIPFYSACEHHLLPFFGLAHVAYLPQKGSVTGLSKLARLVDVYAKRPQVQERMTDQVADSLYEELDALGVLVVLEAEHLCMNMRGVQKPGSKTKTIATRGVYRDDQVLREEVLHLL